MNKYKFIFLLLTSFISQSCCLSLTRDRKIDNIGVPEKAKYAYVSTIIPPDSLIQVLEYVLALDHISIRKMNKNLIITEGFVLPNISDKVRLIINLYNSNYIISAEYLRDEYNWKSVYNCGYVGNECFLEITRLNSRVNTKFINFGVKSLFWIWPQDCRCY